MCFPSSPRKTQHKNRFDPHLFPGQSRKDVCLLVFFSPDLAAQSSHRKIAMTERARSSQPFCCGNRRVFASPAAKMASTQFVGGPSKSQEAHSNHGCNRAMLRPQRPRDTKVQTVKLPKSLGPPPSPTQTASRGEIILFCPLWVVWMICLKFLAAPFLEINENCSQMFAALFAHVSEQIHPNFAHVRAYVHNKPVRRRQSSAKRSKISREYRSTQ